VFAYNKNYQEGAKGGNYDKVSDINSEIDKVKVFTLDFVIKKLIDYGEDQAESRVRQVAHWKIKTTENVLRSLLKNGMDRVATYAPFFFTFF
jgi:hypothetical protein